MTAHAGRRILLVEDEPHLTEAVSFLFSREGWTVHTHTDGSTVMARLQAHRPDAVVLDVMLPGRSGYEILQDLRRQDDFADLPILVLTARGQEKDRALAMSLGASRFMSKPFSNQEVVEAMRHLLADHG